MKERLVRKEEKPATFLLKATIYTTSWKDCHWSVMQWSLIINLE